MIFSISRPIRAILITLSIANFFSPKFSLGAAATQPATQAATSQPAIRRADLVLQEWKAVGSELQALLPSPQTIADPAKRDQIAPSAIPLLKKSIALADELAVANPRYKPRAVRVKYQMLSILSIMGNADADAALTDAEHSSDKLISIEARGARFMATWWRNSTNVTNQSKLLDEVEALAKLHPQDDNLAGLLIGMHEEGAADPSLRERIEKFIPRTMTGPAAQQFTAQYKAAEKLASMRNQPLLILGTTITGENFSTETWQGKVILVHFGAAWCPPWKEEIDRIKALYTTWHSKGLEVVSISCDENIQELKTFLDQNKGIAWPVLRDPNKPLDYPAQYGVEMLPAMFIIDRNGILRSADARDNFEREIPRLIDEKSRQSTP